MRNDGNPFLLEQPDAPPGCFPYQEICAELEEYLEPCPCGGAFKKGSHPRCPSCNRPLSAQVATSYIEKNAPGTRRGGVGKVTGAKPIAWSLGTRKFMTISGVL